MANKTRISIDKVNNSLTVFYDDFTKVDEEPQTTDSSALEAMINDVKVTVWDFELLLINVTDLRLFIYNELFPSDTQEFEEIDYAGLTAPQQTIVNDFINSL